MVHNRSCGNFHPCNNKTNSASGAINSNSNIIEFTATTSTCKEDVVIVKIPDSNSPQTDPLDELQKVDDALKNTNNNKLDSSPKTGDQSLLNTCLLYAAISLIVATSSLLIVISRKRG